VHASQVLRLAHPASATSASAQQNPKTDRIAPSDRPWTRRLWSRDDRSATDLAEGRPSYFGQAGTSPMYFAAGRMMRLLMRLSMK